MDPPPDPPSIFERLINVARDQIWQFVGVLVAVIGVVVAIVGVDWPPPPTPTPTPPPTATALAGTAIPTPTPELTPISLPQTITAADGAPMVLVEAGPFTMGSENGEADEKPVHEITLDAYYIDQYEVTNDQYRQCVQSGTCAVPMCGRPYEDGAKTDHPVMCVTWEQAKTYCEWRGDRLPTEAEWEKAARGMDGRTYPWGEADPNEQLLNFAGNVGDTTPVGLYPEGISPYGVYDMAGNVWEWVQSEYRDYPYRVNDGRESLKGENVRVLRGGSWNYDIDNTRASNRYRIEPSLTLNAFGFRCAR